MSGLLRLVIALSVFVVVYPSSTYAQEKGFLLESYSSEDMYRLGEEFRFGHGKYPKDLKEALDWHLKAAARGNARSMFVIGNMYLKGQGVEANKGEAIAWFKKSVEAGGEGSAAAAEELGGLYEITDCAQSIAMWRRAAELGSVTAQNRLGLMYVNGQCTEKKPEEAVRFLLPAASTGDIISAIFLASLYHKGDGVPQSNVDARYWAEKATLLGWPRLTIADTYLNPIFATPLTKEETSQVERKLGYKLRPLKDGRPVPMYQ